MPKPRSLWMVMHLQSSMTLGRRYVTSSHPHIKYAHVLTFFSPFFRSVIGSLVGKLCKVVRLINCYFFKNSSVPPCQKLILILHILGLVGCVFGIVSSYWDIQKARAMGGREGKASRYIFIYSITQMVLGILEAVIIVGEIDIDITAAAVSLLIPDQPPICVGSCLGCILFELTIE